MVMRIKKIISIIEKIGLIMVLKGFVQVNGFIIRFFYEIWICGLR